ncbi:MAG TPA: class I SAM-dependent methyltransferase [Iamia sp.]|nr:class I SAM-dependent methyltransferase [Iamia sp.]
MNEGHDICDSPEWRDTVRDQIIPWAQAAVDLGDDVLEVGPGFGATTDVFRQQVTRLTSVEIDPVLAGRLADRLAGTNVTVVEGDATALDLPDGRFTGAVCFSMLHHVPTPELQDRIFAEVARVLRPGAPFVASDSVHRADLEAFHEGDTYLPLDPGEVADRLVAQGFVAVVVDAHEYGWAARAHTPT